MKAAIASRTAAGVLAVFALVAIAGEVVAQGGPERAPGTAAPNLGRRPEPLPPLPRSEKQAPEEDAPSANEEAPSAGRGCPNPGRKLELIV
jgi:hypothetical protein